MSPAIALLKAAKLACCALVLLRVLSALAGVPGATDGAVMRDTALAAAGALLARWALRRLS